MHLECEVQLLGWPIRAEALRLDEGWDVSVFGGSRSHVGAVTLAEPDGSIQPCCDGITGTMRSASAGRRRLRSAGARRCACARGSTTTISAGRRSTAFFRHAKPCCKA